MAISKKATVVGRLVVTVGKLVVVASKLNHNKAVRCMIATTEANIVVNKE